MPKNSLKLNFNLFLIVLEIKKNRNSLKTQILNLLKRKKANFYINLFSKKKSKLIFNMHHHAH